MRRKPGPWANTRNPEAPGEIIKLKRRKNYEHAVAQKRKKAVVDVTLGG